MAFLRFMNKLLGVLFNPVLYATKSLLLNTALLVATPIMFLVVAIAAIARLSKGVPTFLLLSLSAAIIVPLLTAVAAIALPIITIADLALSVWRGFKNGFEKGLTYGLVSLFRDWSKYSLVVRAIDDLSAGSVEHNVHNNGNHGHAGTYWDAPVGNHATNVDQHGFQTYNADAFGPDVQREVPVPPVEVLAAPEARADFSPLSDKELKRAREVKSEDMKRAIERYEVLKETLDVMDEAMGAQRVDDGFYQTLKENNEGKIIAEDVDDPLFHMGIKTPCLLFKQIEVEPGRWKTVRATTHLVDKDTFLAARTKNAGHPLFRDDMNNPGPIDGRSTRYCAIDYDGKGYCHELHELADEIRAGLAPVQREKRERSMNHLANNLGITFLAPPTVARQPDNGQEHQRTYSPK